MNIAKWVDELRVFPRIVLILYMLAVASTLEWYLEFDIKYKTHCDPSTLQVLLDNNIEIKEAERISCSITDAIGRPTGYTTLVSVLVGAGAGIFGFYVNSGNPRKESK